MNGIFKKPGADQSGSVALIAAIVIAVLLGVAALALDVAHMVMVRSQLQKAADAGALAGARGMWPLDLRASANRAPDCANALAKAADAMGKNVVDGRNLGADEMTMEVGTWDYANRQFNPGCTTTINAVRVTTRRQGVVMLFAGIFGVHTQDLAGNATAVMDFAGEVGAGCLPIALNKEYTDPGTHMFINFTPDPADNGGWFTDPPDSSSASNFRDYIDNAACPPLKIGDIINLQNGNDTSVLSDLKNKLAQHPDGWYTFFPVVNTDKFNQSQPIAAFVPVQITQVDNSGSSKGVHITVVTLDEVASALPGGANCGALAPPKAVQ
jgi:Flp pilus assembly protein TadG